jgi:transcriptional regulator with PAS, ATPase and Fis domain
MAAVPSWVEEFPASITVASADGTVTYLNRQARETFKEEGGASLVGTSLFNCHPEPAQSRLREMYARKEPNHYTISKKGQKKIIHQIPWFENGAFAGFVEISIIIPEVLHHFDRG